LKKTFVGEKMVCTAVGQFPEHYLAEGNHPALGNQLVDPGRERQKP
jgi:hypothetical protein